jgi:predicted kinase
MNRKKIVLLSGYAATGKTTFSQLLKRQLGIPCFNKDDIKVILGENIGFADRQENIVLSQTTFLLMLHAAKELMLVNQPMILESNFRPAEGPPLQELIEAQGYRPLTFRFLGDLRVIHERFMARERSPERHPAHKSNDLSDFVTFRQGMEALARFSVGGESITVDTTNFEAVDFQALIRQAEVFLNEEQQEPKKKSSFLANLSAN